MNQNEIDYRYQRVLFQLGMKPEELSKAISNMQVVEFKMFTESRCIDREDSAAIAVKSGMFISANEYYSNLELNWMDVLNDVMLGLKERKASDKMYY